MGQECVLGTDDVSRVKISFPPFLVIKFCPFDIFFHKISCTINNSVTILDFFKKLYRNVYQVTGQAGVSHMGEFCF